MARQRPFGYGVLDGTSVPDTYLDTFPLHGVDEVVLASDGYLSAATTLTEAEATVTAAIAGTYPGTKGVKPSATSFDDRTYVRVRLHHTPARG